MTSISNINGKDARDLELVMETLAGEPTVPNIEAAIYTAIVGYKKSSIAGHSSSFLPALRAVTRRRVGVDSDWIVQDVTGDFVRARKDYWEASFDVAELIGHPGIGVRISVPASSGYYDAERDAFLVNNGLFGRPIRGHEGRIYLNARPSELVSVVSEITNLLVKRDIAFKIKCGTKIDLVDRRDNVVVYVRQEHLGWVSRVLAHHSQFHALLRTEVPLFTRQIASGIAVAESPNEGVSFCQFLAREIGAALTKTGVAESQAVQDQLLANGLHIGQLYRSAGSKTYYWFD
ncbi:hypothetical protein GR247_11020 [Rhizobium leguminosarum]|nr:hypothetical protein [Rhizobium leguminosarum]